MQSKYELDLSENGKNASLLRKTKESKQKLVQDFAEFYADELKGQVSNGFLLEKHTRVMTKTFTYYLLQELSEPKIFHLFPSDKTILLMWTAKISQNVAIRA